MPRNKFLLLSFTLLLPMISGSFVFKTKESSFDVSQLNVYGRYVITDSHEIELISSASHFGFSFLGTECKVFIRVLSRSYLQYEIDGVYQKRVAIDAKGGQFISIKAPTKGMHNVWIYKTTEAHSGPVFIEKIVGNKIVGLQQPKAPLIEFIGNSITCGAASDFSEMPCGKGEYQDYHNSYYAYGPRVARALGVRFLISGVSGIGIYRNWNSDGPNMLQVYEKTDFQEAGDRLWDFKSNVPQIVSIALGTNDLSDGDGQKLRLPFDSTVYVANYVKFIQLVKTKYPKTQIAILSSPMISGSKRVVLQNCINAIKGIIDSKFPNEKPVAVYFFEPMQASGCTGHPSVSDHAVMAAELVPFFKKLLP